MTLSCDICRTTILASFYPLRHASNIWRHFSTRDLDLPSCDSRDAAKGWTIANQGGTSWPWGKQVRGQKKKYIYLIQAITFATYPRTAVVFWNNIQHLFSIMYVVCSQGFRINVEQTRGSDFKLLVFGLIFFPPFYHFRCFNYITILQCSYTWCHFTWL